MRFPAPPSATETVIDAIAVARLVRLLQEDDVWPMPELRDVAMRKAGDSRWADLAQCPFCLGVWVAALVVVLRIRFPRIWPYVARILGGSSAAGYLSQLG